MKSLYTRDTEQIIHNVNSTLPSRDSIVFVPCTPNPFGVSAA